MKRRRLLSLALVGVLAIGVTTLIGCGRSDREPTSTPTVAATSTVPTEATDPPTVESGADESWQRVQAAGKIVVGTSADYPPFEFYVEGSRIDGYDIALMDEIGRRLGVEVEYRDIAFDGLSGALQVGQIDAAIAAISVTPERQAVLDFSNVYYVGEDAALARGDSTANIGTPRDLASYQIGVQMDTVYETWVQQALVDSGLMPIGNLHVYQRIDDALHDLDEQRVGLVILDAQAAEAAASARGLKVVGRGLNLQRLAIAFPEGAASLKAEIDAVLTQLGNEGFTAELAREYMNVGADHVLPTPGATPAPPTPEPATPESTPPCIDAMAFVEHLTQQGEILPGQNYTKGWRVQNTGTCTWNTNYRLEFASGQAMGGSPVAVTRSVAPGETYDFQAPLVAPLNDGQYQAVWQMVNEDNQAFGERLVVVMTVGARVTPTPAPTQTPVPGIDLSVDRSRIREGECVTFSWDVQNVRAVYFHREGEPWQDHGVPGQATQRECPPVRTTYVLRVTRLDDTVDVRKITTYVEAAPEAPDIARFTVDPPNQITLGQCVSMRWEVKGNVSSVKLTANGETLWDTAPTSGSYEDCPSAAGTVAYGIEAEGSGGTSRGQQNINVVQAATATPVPTPAPEQPAIYSFSVTPNQIADGECVDVNWSAGGGTSYVRVLRNDTPIVDDGPLTGHGNDCPTPAGSYTYRLEAFNPVGQSVSQQQVVNVTAAAVQNPLADTFWEATVVGTEAVLPGTRLTAAFDRSGQVNGSSGCNTYSASYSVDGNTLLIGMPSATGQECVDPPFIMDQENAFLRGLSTASSFTKDAGGLRITTEVGTIEFVPVGP